LELLLRELVMVWGRLVTLLITVTSVCRTHAKVEGKLPMHNLIVRMFSPLCIIQVYLLAHPIIVRQI